MAFEAGQQLLHYHLIEKIGEGGMGVVWKALDTHLDREIAVKILRQWTPRGRADSGHRIRIPFLDVDVAESILHRLYIETRSTEFRW